MIITEKIYNIETGEQTFIEREETADETKTRLDAEIKIAADQAAATELAAAEAAKAEQRAALLERLGITADEAKLLLA